MYIYLNSDNDFLGRVFIVSMYLGQY